MTTCFLGLLSREPETSSLPCYIESDKRKAPRHLIPYSLNSRVPKGTVLMVTLLGQKYVGMSVRWQASLGYLFSGAYISVEDVNTRIHGTQGKLHQSHGKRGVCSRAYVKMGSKSSGPGLKRINTYWAPILVRHWVTYFRPVSSEPHNYPRK